MASNEELAKQIAGYCESLGKDSIDTKDMNNAEMADILKDLKAEAKEAEAAEKQAIEDAEAEAAEKAEKKPPYYVAAGKSIACKKGILAEGDEVKAAFLGGGKDSLTALVKSKHVIKS